MVTETELLGDHVRQTRRRNKQQDAQNDAIFKNLAELSIGQPVVHIEHGIGRYLGLQTIESARAVWKMLLTHGFERDREGDEQEPKCRV